MLSSQKVQEDEKTKGLAKGLDSPLVYCSGSPVHPISTAAAAEVKKKVTRATDSPSLAIIDKFIKDCRSVDTLAGAPHNRESMKATEKDILWYERCVQHNQECRRTPASEQSKSDGSSSMPPLPVPSPEIAIMMPIKRMSQAEEYLSARASKQREQVVTLLHVSERTSSLSCCKLWAPRRSRKIFSLDEMVTNLCGPAPIADPSAPAPVELPTKIFEYFEAR